MSTKTVQVKPLTLSSNIGTSNTTAIVSGMIGLDGVDLTQADFGTIIYGTFEPNTTREEAVSFTITSNTGGVANIDFGVSGRGLIGKSPYGTGGITYAHSAGAKLVISNNPNLFNKFTAKDNDEEVTGAWEFPTPSASANPATKGYVDTEIAATEALVTAEAATRAAADTALDNATVKKTGDETVAGVKTFSSSPIVPTATTATQAVNKSQVEAYIAPLSGDIKASDTAFGTVRLDEPADDIANPEALTATADRVAALAGGGDFGTPSATNKFITEQYPYISANMNFGDGSDGDVIISGTTTLTRDMYYNNLTVNATLNTDGYRIFVKGTLSGTGTIANDNTSAGGAGGNTGTGNPGAGGAAKGSGPWKGVAGVSGGSGGDQSPVAQPGVAGIAGNKGLAGAAGGAGGTGYTGSPGGAAGAGGTFDSSKPFVDRFNVMNFAYFNPPTALALYTIPGAGGGGGGEGRNGYDYGGGGGGSGASGGVIIIIAKIWAGNFVISANGSNGGNGGGAVNGTYGGGGGGAGGSGGVVVVLFGTKTWTGSYSLTGGTGGTGGVGGTGNGANGNTGTTGTSYEYNVNSLI